MLVLDQVTKRFDQTLAVDDVGFSVDRGAVYGVLGPNGAGKTTSIRMIMGILEPDSGAIKFDGRPIRELPPHVFGYLPEERGLYQKQKLLETVVYFAMLKGISSGEAKSRAARWLDRFNLADYANRKIRELSKGNQQKVQFLLTLIHEPILVVLDEPFSGLDPVNQLLLKEIIQEQQKKGVTFLFSTHQMEQVERLCTNICLINRGRIVLEGELAQIRRDFKKNVAIVSFTGNLPENDLQRYLAEPSLQPNHLEGVLKGEAKEFLDWLNRTVTINSFVVRPPTLEEIFIETVKGQA